MSTRREKVLVVDDAAIMRGLLQKILARCGYTVVTASNGQEALALLAQESMRIVITDLHMPVMDGRTFLREVKQQNPETSVIVLSADPDLSHLEPELSREGAYAVLNKTELLYGLPTLLRELETERGTPLRENLSLTHLPAVRK